MALEHVVTQIRQQTFETGAVASHWMFHPALQADGFEAVLLGSSWHLRPSVDASTTATQEWPRKHVLQFSAVTGLGSASSVRVASQC